MRKSTTMVQDGTERLVHLIRENDGLYTLVAEDVPGVRGISSATNEAGEPVNVGFTEPAKPGFSVDLTQAVMQAMRAEIRERSKMFTTACTKAEEDRRQAGAENAPMSAEEVAHHSQVDRMHGLLAAQQTTFDGALTSLREEIASLTAKVDRRGD